VLGRVGSRKVELSQVAGLGFRIQGSRWEMCWLTGANSSPYCPPRSPAVASFEFGVQVVAGCGFGVSTLNIKL